MKKIILTIALMVGFIATCYAEGDKTDAAALDIFKVLMNSSGKAEWSKKDDYNKKSIMFNGHEISVYYIAEYSLVGLSCRLNANDLPEEALNRIKKRYSDCVIADALIFMDSDGHVKYYAVVKNRKRCIALKISSGCRLRVMKKIPIK
jgi:hypothetical protein